MVFPGASSRNGGQRRPKAIELRAGPLRMVFEPGEAFVRYVRLGGQEVLRGVYAAVRDRNWGTVKPQVRLLRVRRGDDSFEVSFAVECREGDIDFAWNGRLTGTRDGTVVYEFDGLARVTFLRNRIGFCVLHPIEPCAGRPCTVRKADGTTVEGRFPQWISPHQPFKEMRGISHEAAGGITAEVTFDGDLFEMEDQRNWTDASYKTYCTPLELPFPVEVGKGERIRQSVTLRLKGPGGAMPAAPGKAALGEVSKPHPAAAARPHPDAAVELDVDLASLCPLPKIGLGLASHGRPLSDRQAARLRALNLDHLRVDLRLGEGDWRKWLEQADRQARQLDVSLQAAVMLTDNAEAELAALLAECRRLKPPVGDWLVFHVAEKSTSRKWVELAAEMLRTGGVGGRIVCGTNAYFAELNRNRPPLEVCEAICYSVNPQVHAFDDASLVETLAAQAYTVDSARQFGGAKPVLVTPVTLRPRFNPNATGPDPPTPAGQVPPQVDPRQPSLFAAAWTLGSIKYLAQAGADSVTYYETTGWRGVMELEEGAPIPERFPSVAGGVFPLYHVLADVGELAGDRAGLVRSAHPLHVEAMALVGNGRHRLLLCNFTQSHRKAAVKLEGASTGRIVRLDRSSAGIAMSRPEEFRSIEGEEITFACGKADVDLPPECVARLDLQTKG